MRTLVFLYGISARFRQYQRGTTDPVPRTDDLPGRIPAGTKMAFSTGKQFDRDPGVGLMHAFVFWRFLTLLSRRPSSGATWTSIGR